MSSPKRPPRSRSVDGGGRTPSRPDSSGNADGASSEAIQVAIRLRPLNSNESALKTVWRVLPKYSSIAQTTKEGKAMPESVQGRNFFTYDKVFGEVSSTKEIYDSVAKGIVGSACNGLHGTIFAYGQTSSGKTFTMQGSGTIEEGSQGAGGIVHMAASEIFDHIARHTDREFAVRASFLEIYNEEVRDLLSNDSKVLQIREDPVRGVFVEAEEKPVPDFSTLLSILFQGDKSRTFAQTAMNERSSRSHTIFRITIESKLASAENNANDGAIQVSNLNLVDLAGSESVRHTGATGDRQVEGGMINRSLLTLSRVIVSLGNQGQSHINFRDSKLTRLLQPSLSGNARMAVICCATPSELYLEETRSTLAFASRAKLVKTNAQVNEVVSDQTRIRRLMKENAVLKNALAGKLPLEQTTEDAKQSNNAKMKRVASVLLQTGPAIFETAFPADTKRRRHSYATEPRAILCTTPDQVSGTERPFSEHKLRSELNADAKILFRDEVVSAKTSIIGDQSRRLDAKQSELLASKFANDVLLAERSNDEHAKAALQKELQEIKFQLAANVSQLHDVAAQLEQERVDRKLFECENKDLKEKLDVTDVKLKEMDILRDKCQSTEADIKLHLATNAELQEQNSAVQSDLQGLESKCTQYEESLRLRDEEIAGLREEMNTLQREKAQSETDAMEANQHLLAAKNDVDLARVANEKLEQQLERLVEDLAEAEQKVLTSETNNANAQDEHKRQIIEIQQEQALNKSQIVDLREQVNIQESARMQAEGAYEELSKQHAKSVEELKESEDKRLQYIVDLDGKSALIATLESAVALAEKTYSDQLLHGKQQEETNHELSLEVSCLENKLGKANEIKKELGEQLASSETKVESLKREIPFLQSKIDESTDENARLQTELTQLSQCNEDLQKKCAILLDENAQSTQYYDMASSAATTRNQELSRRVIVLECVLSFVSKNESALQDCLDAAQVEKISQQDRITEITAELIQTKATVSALSSSHKAYTKKVDLRLSTMSSMMSFMASSDESSKEMMASLHEQNVSLRTENSDLTNRNILAESRLDDLKLAECDRIRDLESDLERTKMRGDSVEAENASLNSNNIELSDSLRELQNRFCETESSLEETRALNMQHQELISGLERDIASLATKHEQLSKVRDSLAAELALKENTIRETTDNLVGQLETYSQECQSLKDELQKSANEIDRIGLLHRSSEENAEELMGVIAKLKEEDSNQKDQYQLLEAKLHESLSHAETLKQACLSHEDTKQRLDTQSKQNDHLVELLKCATQDSDNLKTALDVEKQQLEQLQHTLGEAQFRSRDAEEKLQLLEQEKAELQLSLSEAANELTDAKTACQHVRGSMEKSVENEKRLAKQVAQLQAVVDESAKAEASMDLQRELEQAIEAKREIVKDAEAKMKQLRRELSHATDAKSSIEKEAYICRQMKEELEDQVEALETERTALSAKTEDLEMSVSDLRSDVKAMKSELIVAQDGAKKLQRELESERSLHQKDLLRLQQENYRLKTERNASDLGSVADTDREKMKLESENAEYRLLLVEKDKRIQKLSKSKLTERHIETMKQYKNENKSYRAEIDYLKSQIAASKESNNALVTSNLTIAPSQQCDMSTVQELQFAKLATETKYSKLKTEFQDLKSEHRQAVEALRSSSVGQSLFGTNSVDLSQAIAVLCDKVTSSDTSSALTVNDDATRSSLASTEAAKIELQMKLTKAMKQDAEKACLLETKDREMGVLQKENLHLMDKLSQTRKERDEFKARNNALHKQARTVGVRDLPPSSAVKFKIDHNTPHTKSPRRSSSKSNAKFSRGADKENSVDSQHANPTPSRSSSKRNASTAKTIPQKKSKLAEEELHGAFGAPCDEPTGDCKQS